MVNTRSLCSTFLIPLAVDRDEAISQQRLGLFKLIRFYISQKARNEHAINYVTFKAEQDVYNVDNTLPGEIEDPQAIYDGVIDIHGYIGEAEEIIGKVHSNLIRQRSTCQKEAMKLQRTLTAVARQHTEVTSDWAGPTDASSDAEYREMSERYEAEFRAFKYLASQLDRQMVDSVRQAEDQLRAVQAEASHRLRTLAPYFVINTNWWVIE